MIWQACLDLQFEDRAGRAASSSNKHIGPLQVQKILYPEGPLVAHVAVLHPPGGIAAGDHLTVTSTLQSARPWAIEFD